jgi:glycosyltransferase involved in cell wall biosynthesis
MSIDSASLDRKIRVAYFSDSLPERNGTGAYYHDLLGQLAPSVEALEIFQPQENSRQSHYSIPMPGDPSQRLIAPDFRRIAKGYKALRPDIVVAVTPGPFGLLGRYYAKRSGAAFLTAFHTDFEQLARLYWRPITQSIVNGYLRNINRFLCKSSAAVLVNNSNLYADVTKLGAKKVEVMGTPLQSSFLKTPQTFPAKKVKRICFAGRLAAEKNVDQIIDAAANFPEIEFFIGGDGPERKSLEAAAAQSPNVTFMGWLNRTQLIELLDSSSCLLLPSKLETFGSVALEAMARGRPALVSANAGIHDWKQLKEGLIALDADKSLSQAIATCLEQPAEYWQATAQKARQAAEKLNRETLSQWTDVLEKYAALNKA